jgi:hypothetical protein
LDKFKSGTWDRMESSIPLLMIFLINLLITVLLITVTLGSSQKIFFMVSNSIRALL